MNTIRNALTWRGSGAMLSMFVITRAAEALLLDLVAKGVSPSKVLTYRLDDDANVLEGRAIFVYDAEFPDVPADIDSYLRTCLSEAMRRGADVAWFAFEGSFSFEYLLAPVIASQVYAVADRDGVSVSEDATLMSEAWSERVAATRRWALEEI